MRRGKKGLTNHSRKKRVSLTRIITKTIKLHFDDVDDT